MNGRRGAVAAVACLGLLAGCASAPPVRVSTPPPPMDPVTVAAAVDPALVNISSDGGLFDATASGSGIVLTPDGEVLTSHHVIKGAERIDVVDVGTGATYVATVLGFDRDRDIALLDLPDVDGLPVARLGEVLPRVGAEVLAIGNAGGAGGVPTAVGGRIVDLDRTIVARNAGDLTRKALSGLIEVRAPVTAGQSGVRWSTVPARCWGCWRRHRGGSPNPISPVGSPFRSTTRSRWSSRFAPGCPPTPSTSAPPRRSEC